MPEENLSKKIVKSVASNLLESSMRRDFPDVPPLLNMLVEWATADNRLPAGYKDYIASDSWKGYRQAVLMKIPLCIACFAVNDLHIHHLTYRRFKQERLSDCVPLCYRCHAWVHKDGAMPVEWMVRTYPDVAEALDLSLNALLDESEAGDKE
jgi:hypothetical protein